ncbi:response regulator, partial [Clostridioides difficile]|uniref:response regulator n=1 Tax=Clostridioides difficile TaxID=1496 RepID=UPI003F8D242A
FTVYKFYTGKEALECIESKNLDMAILDIMLPDIDGFHICQKITSIFVTNFYKKRTTTSECVDATIGTQKLRLIVIIKTPLTRP